MTADQHSSSQTARLSVVLATDNYQTIRPVIARLKGQTIQQQIEIVLTGGAGGLGDIDSEDLKGFAGVQIIEARSLVPLALARAAGVRAASAPFVFIGETHTYPDPDWAEALLTAFEHSWAAVVPAIDNANPQSATSWAAYLSDYGTWGSVRPAGELPDPLIYNTAYRRSVLLELGNKLEEALSPYTEVLWPRLHAAGHRAVFEPRARITHLNVARPHTYLYEKFVAGLLVSTHRAAHWGWLRRAKYVIGSPAIPLVLFSRLMKPIGRIRRKRRLPFGTLPLVVIGAVVKAVGELTGYAGLARIPPEEQMAEIELHKVKYAGWRRQEVDSSPERQSTQSTRQSP